MSLDKAIKYGKEKRKPYYKSKAFDRTCRNHQGCPRCEGNRLVQRIKQDRAALADLTDLHLGVC